MTRLFLTLSLIITCTYGAAAQKKYPYTADGGHNGPLIVSRDDNGGVHPQALVDGASGSIESSLQIATEDATDNLVSWAGAKDACFGGWRLPTKRELQLIWLTGGARYEQYKSPIIVNDPLHEYNAFAPLDANKYWTSTTEGGNVWSVDFSNGASSSGTTTGKVRCVKGQSEDSFIAYTKSYKNSILYIEAKDAKNISIPWDAIDTACSVPYRLPNKNELALMWVYRDAFPQHNFASIYWSSTQFSATRAWRGFMHSTQNGGSLNYIDIEGARRVRCIMDNPNKVRVYPYTDDTDKDNGPIIVSADNDGGVALSTLTSSPGEQVENTLAPKLQVRNTDIGTDQRYDWDSAKAECVNLGDKWRLPTQREMHLIWLMGGAESEWYDIYQNHFAGADALNNTAKFDSFNTLRADDYFTITPSDFDEDYVWKFNMKMGACTTGGIKANRNYVRCVRTID